MNATQLWCFITRAITKNYKLCEPDLQYSMHEYNLKKMMCGTDVQMLIRLYELPVAVRKHNNQAIDRRAYFSLREWTVSVPDG